MGSTASHVRPETPVPCTVCGGTAASLLFRSDAEVYRCAYCTHAFSDMASIADLETYGPEYYERIHQNWFAHPDLDLFAWIAAQFPEGTRSVLDVGCGKGAFLRFLRDGRYQLERLVGVDISPNDPETGIEYRQADFSKMRDDERFDVVVSLAVIEHVSNPVAFVRGLATRCNPGGVVVVMTLDNDSLLYAAARLLANIGVRAPAMRLYSAHHLQHFTHRSLKAALKEVGLEVIVTCHHNAPMAALDIPARNFLVKLAFTAGVAGLFWLGTLTRRTYLQTIAATRRKT